MCFLSTYPEPGTEGGTAPAAGTRIQSCPPVLIVYVSFGEQHNERSNTTIPPPEYFPISFLSPTDPDLILGPHLLYSLGYSSSFLIDHVSSLLPLIRFPDQQPLFLSKIISSWFPTAQATLVSACAAWNPHLEGLCSDHRQVL